MGCAAAKPLAIGAILTLTGAAGLVAAKVSSSKLPPSKSWDDGENFQPTEAFIQAIIRECRRELVDRELKLKARARL